MTSRSAALGALALGLSLPPAVLAQKLDKDEKKWFDSVRPIMLPEEEKVFKGLKEKADRAEFQKIFWARRDADLETPENEYQQEYTAAAAQADSLYRIPGRAGSETDCGRVFLLLGKPDEVKKESMGNPALRVPEVWTYKDRPGQTFTGGKAEISLDENCALPQGARLRDQLDRLAEAKIAQPNIGYKFDKGRLVKLADQLPKPTPAQALLKTPRQDYPMASQAGYLKVQDGGTAVLGLVRGDASGLTVEDVGGQKKARVVVVANATNAEGKVAAFSEQQTLADVKDGQFVAGFRMGLKPGKYSLRAGALDEKTGKGSVADSTIDVPDYNKGELAAASVFALQDVQELPEGAVDPHHPFAAYDIGKARLIPRFGGVFAKSEAVSFFYQVYDAKVDEATGKASAAVSVAMLKAAGRAAVAKAEDQTYETPVFGNVIGPIPLGTQEAGKYVLQLRVKDNVAKKDITQEVAFEVKP
jgi:GWxTD domain-containing protein